MPFMLLFSVVLSKDALWRLWCCIVDHLNEHIQKVLSHLKCILYIEYRLSVA